jgi:hypothetical protein
MRRPGIWTPLSAMDLDARWYRASVRRTHDCRTVPSRSAQRRRLGGEHVSLAAITIQKNTAWCVVRQFAAGTLRCHRCRGVLRYAHLDTVSLLNRFETTCASLPETRRGRTQPICESAPYKRAAMLLTGVRCDDVDSWPLVSSRDMTGQAAEPA